MAYTKGYRGYGNYYAGRGFYRRRIGSTSGIKRSQIPTKITRSEVAQIAKKQVQKQVELKYFNNSFAGNLVQGAWYVSNLMTGFTQNVSSEGHIGRKITIKGLKFRIRWAVDAGNSSGAVTRFMVFKTSQQLTASSSAAVVQGDIFRNNPSTFDPTSMPDMDSITVLYDNTRVLNPQTESTANGDNMFQEIYIPHRRVVTFLGDNDAYAKEDNYYAYFAMGRDNAGITNAGYIGFSWEVDYWDA